MVVVALSMNAPRQLPSAAGYAVMSAPLTPMLDIVSFVSVRFQEKAMYPVDENNAPLLLIIEYLPAGSSISPYHIEELGARLIVEPLMVLCALVF